MVNWFVRQELKAHKRSFSLSDRCNTFLTASLTKQAFPGQRCYHGDERTVACLLIRYAIQPTRLCLIPGNLWTIVKEIHGSVSCPKPSRGACWEPPSEGQTDEELQEVKGGRSIGVVLTPYHRLWHWNHFLAVFRGTNWYVGYQLLGQITLEHFRAFVTEATL